MLLVLGTIYLDIAFMLTFLLMEGHVQGTLQKELHDATFVKRFKTASLGKSF